MSYERHCKSCGAINADEARERCDGCGKLAPRGELPRSIILPDLSDRFRSQNPISLCPECYEKVVVPTWNCARCEHPRHMHNAGCMVIFGPLPEGGHRCCDCSEFVPPPPKENT